MNKADVVDAIREAICQNDELVHAVFGSETIPNQIDDIILAISSLDFVDLTIALENRLHIELSEYIYDTKISIGELAQRIVDYA